MITQARNWLSTRADAIYILSHAGNMVIYIEQQRFHPIYKFEFYSNLQRNLILLTNQNKKQTNKGFI